MNTLTCKGGGGGLHIMGLHMMSNVGGIRPSRPFLQSQWPFCSAVSNTCKEKKSWAFIGLFSSVLHEH